MKREIAAVDSQLLQYSKALKEIDDQRKNKHEQNEMDDSASYRLKKIIDTAHAVIDRLVSQNEVLIGRTVVNRSDWEELIKSLAFSLKTSKKVTDKMMLLSDLMTYNDFKIDQDVFFEPSQYHLTSAIAVAIGKIFDPVAKRIDLFIKKYPDFPLYLIITAKGYADGTPITEGSMLYNELRERLQLKKYPSDSKELNKELSRARAFEVIKHLQKFTVDRSIEGGNIKNIAYIYEGKGEALPNPLISDYRTPDSRRRVVLIYWSIFPE